LFFFKNSPYPQTPSSTPLRSADFSSVVWATPGTVPVL